MIHLHRRRITSISIHCCSCAITGASSGTTSRTTSIILQRDGKRQRASVTLTRGWLFHSVSLSSYSSYSSYSPIPSCLSHRASNNRGNRRRRNERHLRLTNVAAVVLYYHCYLILQLLDCLLIRILSFYESNSLPSSLFQWLCKIK